MNPRSTLFWVVTGGCALLNPDELVIASNEESRSTLASPPRHRVQDIDRPSRLPNGFPSPIDSEYLTRVWMRVRSSEFGVRTLLVVEMWILGPYFPSQA